MQSLRYRRLDTPAACFIPASRIFSLFALHLSSHPACGSTKVPAFTETAKTTFLPPAEDKESFKTGPQLRYGAARGYFAQVQEAFVYRPGLQSYQYSGSQFERSEPVSTRQYWCTVLAGQVSAACPAGIGHAAETLVGGKVSTTEWPGRRSRCGRRQSIGGQGLGRFVDRIRDLLGARDKESVTT